MGLHLTPRFVHDAFLCHDIFTLEGEELDLSGINCHKFTIIFPTGIKYLIRTTSGSTKQNLVPPIINSN